MIMSVYKVARAVTRKLQNILRGIGSVVDIAPAPRQNQIVNPAHGRSDADAVKDDWRRVGEDIHTAIARVESEVSDGHTQR